MLKERHSTWYIPKRGSVNLSNHNAQLLISCHVGGLLINFPGGAINLVSMRRPTILTEWHFPTTVPRPATGSQNSMATVLFKGLPCWITVPYKFSKRPLVSRLSSLLFSPCAPCRCWSRRRCRRPHRSQRCKGSYIHVAPATHGWSGSWWPAWFPGELAFWEWDK